MHTQLVGILNVTPDSFFDGGRYAGIEEAVRQGRRLVEEGAALIDLGGQSTRPGHAEISAEEEMARILPVIKALVKEVAVPLSIDTYKPAVARAALAAGGGVLNDVHGFQGDPGMAEVAAAQGCPVILMHNDPDFPKAPGTPVEKLRRFFERSLEIARSAGVAIDRIILDPGIGFSKTHEQNLAILGSLAELRSFGRPLLLGASRKSSIGRVLGVGPSDSLEGTLAVTVLAVVQGVEYVRVHDVLANARAARMAEAVLDNASLRAGSSIRSSRP